MNPDTKMKFTEFWWTGGVNAQHLRACEAVARLHLATPLRATDAACVLILEVLRIRLDIQDVTKGGIGLGRAGGVRAGDRFQAGEGGVQHRVLVKDRRSLPRGGGCETCLQDEGLFCVFRSKHFVIAAVLALQEERTIGLNLKHHSIAANLTELERRHRTYPVAAVWGCHF